MSDTSFSSILDKTVDSVDKPKPIPVGTYLGLVDGIPRFDKSTVRKTDFVEFNVKLLQAKEDVDQSALADVLGGKVLQDKSMRRTFYLTEDAVWRLDDFLFNHLDGIPLGTSRKQAISMAPGKQVLLSVRHNPSQDGTTVYAEISSTARA